MYGKQFFETTFSFHMTNSIAIKKEKLNQVDNILTFGCTIIKLDPFFQ